MAKIVGKVFRKSHLFSCRLKHRYSAQAAVAVYRGLGPGEGGGAEQVGKNVAVVVLAARV